MTTFVIVGQSVIALRPAGYLQVFSVVCLEQKIKDTYVHVYAFQANHMRTLVSLAVEWTHVFVMEKCNQNIFFTFGKIFMKFADT